MTEEIAFIRTILADPDDATCRLVYADWLEERGDPRGEFLRLESSLAGVPQEEQHGELRRRLQELRACIDPKWLAWIDRARIENCDLRFTFQCPQRWEKLQPTDDPFVRSCKECRRNVIHCATVEEAREHARSGRCVVNDSRVLRLPGDLADPADEMYLVVGRMAPAPPSPFAIGQRIAIRTGALAGLQGEVERLDERGTATVAITMLGRRSSVELEWWLLEAIS